MADIALQATGVVMQTQCGCRHAPLDALQRHAQVAGQHQVGGAAIDTAVQCAHGDRSQVRPCLRHSFKCTGALCVVLKATDVIARAKHRFGLTCGVRSQHGHPHLWVAVDELELFQQSDQVRVLQPVALKRTVERDARNPVSDVEQWRCAVVSGGHPMGFAGYTVKGKSICPFFAVDPF